MSLRVESERVERLEEEIREQRRLIEHVTAAQAAVRAQLDGAFSARLARRLQRRVNFVGALMVAVALLGAGAARYFELRITLPRDRGSSELRCENGDAEICTLLARHAPAVERIAPLARRACVMGDAEGCDVLGQLLLSEEHKAWGAAALALACHQGYGDSCVALRRGGW